MLPVRALDRWIGLQYERAFLSVREESVGVLYIFDISEGILDLKTSMQYF